MAAGAATGMVAGPVGAAVGAAIGAVAGGLAGKGIAERIDPTAEDAYWRENYRGREYVTADATYEDYGPAYRYGVDSYPRHTGRSFEEAESELHERLADRARLLKTGLAGCARSARDAWQRIGDRVERAVPGDSDRDGK